MKKLIIALSISTLALASCGTGDSVDDPVDSDLPAPTLPTDPGRPPSDKPPARSDKMPDNAGEVFIDSVDLLIMESFPIQVSLTIAGRIPTPCHGLGWLEDDDGSTITVTLFSVEPGPAVTCIAVEEAFSLAIPLGSFQDQARTVVVNGAEVGDFTS